MRFWLLLGNELIDTDALCIGAAAAYVVAARVGGRCLPIAWRVKDTQGAIGFPEQKAALEVALALLSEGARVVLMGDRFYGSPDLIA